MDRKNRIINLFKFIISITGFLLWATLGMDYRIIALSLAIGAALQAYQLKINGVTTKISPLFDKSLLVVLTIALTIMLGVIAYAALK